MAHYTTKVRSILETYAGYKEEQDFDKIDYIIAASRGMVFTKEYDLFDPDYKMVIESKILYHYYMREIGAETAGLWKYYMNRTMTEIMPYYNELYKSALLDFDPLNDVDYTREGDRAGTEDSTLTTSTSETEQGTHETETENVSFGDNKDRYSDTPQNGLSAVDQGQYLTTYRNITENRTDSGIGSATDTVTTSGNSRGVNDVDTTEKWLERIRGKMGATSYSKLLSEYRDTLLNIDEMVIKEFEKCFLQLV